MGIGILALAITILVTNRSTQKIIKEVVGESAKNTQRIIEENTRSTHQILERLSCAIEKIADANERIECAPSEKLILG